MALRLFLRNGTFYVRGTVRGQSVYETTGTADESAAEAIRIKREAKLLAESIHGKAATATFAEAAASYLDAGGSPRFLGQYDGATSKWSGLIGLFGSRVLNTITQSDLDAAANKLYPGTQADTRNRQCHTPFIAVWNHAYHNQWCERRDWLRPRKPKGTKAKLIEKKFRAGTKPVDYQRAAQFVLAMSPAPAMLMTTLFYTGMRPIELFTLEPHEVDIERRWIALDASKTDAPRGIPIHDMLVPLLSGLCSRKGFLFRTPRGKPYELKEDGGGQMKTAILGARKRSGIKDIAPYTARHTVSTQLVLNGVHPYIKDQIMGHAVAGDMSRHYVNIPNPHCVDAIRTLPVIEAWASAPWMHDPIAWERRLVEGTGRRSDLTRRAA
jgi:integrase/recombinase XerD